MDILDLIQLVMRMLMVPVGFFVGGATERSHLRSLESREAQFKDMRVNNLKRIAQPESVAVASMVVGQVVIATDYYKSLVTSLKNMIGGEMKAVKSLCTRARREALLRLMEEARTLGATEVWNVRYGFSNIAGTGSQAAIQIELIAYGTAVVRK